MTCPPLHAPPPGDTDDRVPRFELTLDGLGERFSGRYSVTASEHHVDTRGYRTLFHARREETP